MAGVWHELFITTVLPSTAVFFHGTYRGAKSVVPRNTTLAGISIDSHIQNAPPNDRDDAIEIDLDLYGRRALTIDKM